MGLYANETRKYLLLKGYFISYFLLILNAAVGRGKNFFDGGIFLLARALFFWTPLCAGVCLGACALLFRWFFYKEGSDGYHDAFNYRVIKEMDWFGVKKFWALLVLTVLAFLGSFDIVEFIMKGKDG